MVMGGLENEREEQTIEIRLGRFEYPCLLNIGTPPRQAG